MKAEKLLDKIKDNFPDISWTKYEHTTRGWDHEIIILDRKIVFRFPKAESYLKALPNEIKLMKYLQPRMAAKIPEYKYIPEDLSFAGYDLIPGVELDEDVLKKMNKDDQAKVITQIAAFLTTLQRTPREKLEELKVRKMDYSQEYREFVGKLNKIMDRFSDEEREKIAVFLEELKAASRNKFDVVLIHGDLSSEHMLWDGSAKQVNMIDFSDRRIGDPAADFGGLWEYGEAVVEKIYDLYDGLKDKNFLARAKLYSKRGPFWAMIDSQKGFPVTFEEGYERFKKEFGD